MTDIKEIVQSPLFAKYKKKISGQQIIDLDKAVKSIADDPTIGDMKMGDLRSIQIYKFKSNDRQILLAYEVSDSKLILYTYSSYENFYQELKNYLRH